MPRVNFASSCRSVPSQVPELVDNQNCRVEVKEAQLWGAGEVENERHQPHLRCSGQGCATHPRGPAYRLTPNLKQETEAGNGQSAVCGPMIILTEDVRACVGNGGSREVWLGAGRETSG